MISANFINLKSQLEERKRNVYMNRVYAHMEFKLNQHIVYISIELMFLKTLLKYIYIVLEPTSYNVNNMTKFAQTSSLGIRCISTNI